MNITPHEDRVAIRLEEPESVSPGGLYIPSQSQEKPIIGKVIAVGPGRVVNGQRIPMEVAPGDRVVLGHQYAGSEVEFDGEQIVLARHDEIVAVIE